MPRPRRRIPVSAARCARGERKCQCPRAWCDAPRDRLSRRRNAWKIEEEGLECKFPLHPPQLAGPAALHLHRLPCAHKCRCPRACPGFVRGRPDPRRNAWNTGVGILGCTFPLRPPPLAGPAALHLHLLPCAHKCQCPRAFGDARHGRPSPRRNAWNTGVGILGCTFPLRPPPLAGPAALHLHLLPCAHKCQCPRAFGDARHGRPSPRRNAWKTEEGGLECTFRLHPPPPAGPAAPQLHLLPYARKCRSHQKTLDGPCGRPNPRRTTWHAVGRRLRCTSRPHRRRPTEV
mmetsp:Transcript_116323/g.301552  ORF Transcript_116323/g.301552 Transcript_116323/m.301552 type:complete len:289 (-) Transcript_116323:297-1163(-)